MTTTTDQCEQTINLVRCPRRAKVLVRWGTASQHKMCGDHAASRIQIAAAHDRKRLTTITVTTEA